MNTREWDTALFGINKGLGMVQHLLLGKKGKIDAEQLKTDIAKLQEAASQFSFGDIK